MDIVEKPSSPSPVKGVRKNRKRILSDSESSTSQVSLPKKRQKPKRRRGGKRGSAVGVPGRRSSTLVPEKVTTEDSSSTSSEDKHGTSKPMLKPDDRESIGSPTSEITSSNEMQQRISLAPMSDISSITSFDTRSSTEVQNIEKNESDKIEESGNNK